jgi:hypothetical protein
MNFLSHALPCTVSKGPKIFHKKYGVTGYRYTLYIDEEFHDHLKNFKLTTGTGNLVTKIHLSNVFQIFLPFLVIEFLRFIFF